MNLRETIENLGDDFRRDLFFLGASLVIFLGAVGAHNVITPNEPVRTGMVEVETECFGIDAGVCLGIERRTHTTFNYENYSDAEPGTPNFYRRVESELMIQAYSICGEETEGMEWLEDASYLNKSGEEWSQMDQVQLLPCEDTTFRNMTE